MTLPIAIIISCCLLCSTFITYQLIKSNIEELLKYSLIILIGVGSLAAIEIVMKSQPIQSIQQKIPQK